MTIFILAWGIGPAGAILLERSLLVVMFFVILPVIIFLLGVIAAFYLKGIKKLNQMWWIPLLVCSIGFLLFLIPYIIFNW